MKQLFKIAFLAAMLASCSSKKQELLSGVTELELTADSTQAELSGLDPEKAEYWHDEYLGIKTDLVRIAAYDTIPLQLSGDLDNYLSAMAAISDFSAQRTHCMQANDSFRDRLGKLKADIDAQRGERSFYEKYLKAEAAEAKAVRKHCTSLKDQYLKAENAQAQFLPGIERFIRTFVRQ